MLFLQIPGICRGIMLQYVFDREIGPLMIDSRKANRFGKALFFAIKGHRHDGHNYIGELYKKGLRQFIVEDDVKCSAYPEANFFKAPSSIDALQAIVIHHRNKFSFPVVGIAGTRGKTIVKEWLYQLLAADYNCVKSPGSYNSQIGTPLSLWQINDRHELGIFEAGISEIGEMHRQREMIQPTIGLITNVDDDKNFVSEKVSLFKKAETIIYCHDSLPITTAINRLKKDNNMLLSWGQCKEAAVRVHFKTSSVVSFSGYFGAFALALPFADTASRENLLHCILVLLHFNISPQKIQKKIDNLQSVPMRMELKSGINQCQIIDDTYSNDLAGLQIGMEFMAGLSARRKTIILSEMPRSDEDDTGIFSHIADLIKENNVYKLVGVGKGFCVHQHYFDRLPIEKEFYPTTDTLIEQINWNTFRNETILVKGTHDFEFEKIIYHLQEKTHSTVMAIDLAAIVHNLNFFKSLLRPNVKLMVMVKAFAYGSGSNEIARVLQYHRVDYLGVAHADEGVALRRHGIRTPIMVMNPTKENFDALLEYNLEPEIHTPQLLRLLANSLKGTPCGIHLKIDTGMHRLGLQQQDIPAVNTILEATPNLLVKSVFSHLAGADEHIHNHFSHKQAACFRSTFAQLKIPSQTTPPLCHIVNSSGIIRFPQLHWDMVRLGIGLYGIDPTKTIQHQLETAITLKTTVLQVQEVPRGETVGYSRKGLVDKTATIATIAIGYADGFSRNYSKGRGEVLICGKKAPVVGNVCMDMTMVDVTEIDGVQAGDEVIIFGMQPTIQYIAAKIGAIPYELLTAIGGRVKRIFHAESL